MNLRKPFGASMRGLKNLQLLISTGGASAAKIML